jgi:hypothetical protein
MAQRSEADVDPGSPAGSLRQHLRVRMSVSVASSTADRSWPVLASVDDKWPGIAADPKLGREALDSASVIHCPCLGVSVRGLGVLTQVLSTSSIRSTASTASSAL